MSDSLIQTECGSIAFDTYVTKNFSSTKEAIDTSVYTFYLSDSSNLRVDISTTNKTYIQPTPESNWTMTEMATIKAYNSLYSWIYTEISVNVTFKDPCLSLFYLHDPSDTLMNNQSVVQIPTYPLKTFKVKYFTPHIIDDSGSRIADGYCSDFSY